MDHESLSVEARAILAALIAAPFAWQSPGELRSAARLTADQADEALLELDLAGWLDPWSTDDGLDVTLSCLGATNLGAHLEEYGEEEIPRWVVGAPWVPPKRQKAPLARYSALAFVPDPEPADPIAPAVVVPVAEICAPPLIDPMVLEANRRAAAIEEARRQKGLAAKEKRRVEQGFRRAERAKMSRRKKRAKLASRRSSA